MREYLEIRSDKSIFNNLASIILKNNYLRMGR